MELIQYFVLTLNRVGRTEVIVLKLCSHAKSRYNYLLLHFNYEGI